jgi:hypothetical protein
MSATKGRQDLFFGASLRLDRFSQMFIRVDLTGTATLFLELSVSKQAKLWPDDSAEVAVLNRRSVHKERFHLLP